MKSLEQLGRLLLGIEAATPATAGTYLVQEAGAEEPSGRIMVEYGRVCWASSRFYSLRLSDVLAQEAGLQRSQLQTVVRFCREHGKPYGETLIARGLVAPEQLRHALRHQTTSALLAIAKLEIEGRVVLSDFIPTPAKTYDPMFTFSACELLVEAGLLEPIQPPPNSSSSRLPNLSKSVRELAPTMRHACFMETRSRELPALPLALTRASKLRLEDAIAIYRSARALARSPPLTAAAIDARITMIRDAGDRGWLLTYDRRYLSMYELRHASDSGRLIRALGFNSNGWEE